METITMNDQHSRERAVELPEVEGVRIFLPRTGAAYRAFLTGVEAVEQTFRSQSAELIGARATLPTSLRRRAERQLAGMASDLALMHETCEPIRRAARDLPAEDDFIAWASVQTGLSLHDMFIYFYQDWRPSQEFGKVTHWFREVLDQHARDRRSVAVLGAGACGLAHSLASQFTHAHAVDLSLPTLLIARRLIAGEGLSLHLKQANWARVELAPPAPPKGQLSFLAANVTHLPFEAGSLSCVVTQCLFDIVDNPLQLAEEIQRVLAPDGVWVNFSHAFRAPGDPLPLGPRKLEEVPLVLGPVGFEVALLDNKRFAMLDVNDIDPEPPRTEDDVHLFVLRKTAGAAPAAPFRALRERFGAADPALWQMRPRTIAGKDISISTRRLFDSRGTHAQAELRVGPYAMPIPESHANLLASLLQQVDGQSTLRDIYANLAAGGVPLSDSDFLALVHCLSIERYLLDLSPTRAG
jgi:SAM-dependent methyltransferase